MFYVPQLPCYKIYKQSNHTLHIVWFENETNMGHFEQACVGNFLIQFLQMDLSAFQKVMREFTKGNEFNFHLQADIGYHSVCDKMREAADLLSENIHLHRFLLAELDRCFDNE